MDDRCIKNIKIRKIIIFKWGYLDITLAPCVMMQISKIYQKL